MFMTDHVSYNYVFLHVFFTDDILHLTVFVLTGLNCLAYDEAIIAQQDKIQQEVIESSF